MSKRVVVPQSGVFPVGEELPPPAVVNRLINYFLRRGFTPTPGKGALPASPLARRLRMQFTTPLLDNSGGAMPPAAITGIDFVTGRSAGTKLSPALMRKSPGAILRARIHELLHGIEADKAAKLAARTGEENPVLAGYLNWDKLQTEAAEKVRLNPSLKEKIGKELEAAWKADPSEIRAERLGQGARAILEESLAHPTLGPALRTGTRFPFAVGSAKWLAWRKLMLAKFKTNPIMMAALLIGGGLLANPLRKSRESELPTSE